MNKFNIEVPTVEEAKHMLDEASQLNPGPWVEHSLYAGEAAARIAEKCDGLDSETAKVLGMLHDIGRRAGVFSMRHSIDGYNFALEKGYSTVGKICITHSFPYKDMRAVFGKWDCSKEEYDFVENYLASIEFNDYDRLIQLCDALALPDGYTLMEKRMIDVALRHGVNQFTVSKWKATVEIKKHFEEKMGCSIYEVLPGVVENTFRV